MIFGLLVGLFNLLNFEISESSIAPSTLLLIFFSGLQIFFLGLIGEYVLSIHSQTRRQPDSFFIRKINFYD
jgi:hypothetical protein